MKARNQRSDHIYGPLTVVRRNRTVSIVESIKKELGLPRDPLDIVNIDQPDPVLFSSAESFRREYWRAECLSKFPFEIGIDRATVAIQQFRDFEAVCAESNRRLNDVFHRPIPEQYRQWLHRAKMIVHSCLRGFNLDDVIRRCHWGPGATTQLSRRKGSHQNKWVLAAHVTSGALPYFLAFQQYTGWEFPPAVIVEGNKVVTVPKNAKTDRTIAIEPDWNMFFQLGVGGEIRHRMQRYFGALRPNSQEIQKRLALQGSVSKNLATMDLKGASDTISLALVEQLLPGDVLTHILNLRSPTGRLPDGSRVVYEKVSSMGNGFTFELETLLFLALVKACSGHASVYGDDIVLHSNSYEVAKGFLEFCGFTINEKKSHYGSSPFRESCGGHYFNGVDVSPPYVRSELSGLTLLSFGNRIRECSSNSSWTCSILKGTWSLVRSYTPRCLLGPVGVDGVLWTSFDDARPKRSMRFQTYQGCRLVSMDSHRKRADPVGAVRQSVWVQPGHQTWEKPIQFRYRLGRWYRHWEDLPPFSG